MTNATNNTIHAASERAYRAWAKEKLAAAGLGTSEAEDRMIAAIAHEHLGLETLEARNSDRLDFSEHAVWALAKALRMAYLAGREAGNTEARERMGIRR